MTSEQETQSKAPEQDMTSQRVKILIESHEGAKAKLTFEADATLEFVLNGLSQVILNLSESHGIPGCDILDMTHDLYHQRALSKLRRLRSEEK